MKELYGIPATTKVPTPEGPKYAKDLHTGSIIFRADGEWDMVTKVEDIGIQQLYRITVDGWRSVIVSENQPLPIVNKMMWGFTPSIESVKNIVDGYKIHYDGKDTYQYYMPSINNITYIHQPVKISPAIAALLYENIEISNMLIFDCKLKTYAHMIADEFGIRFRSISENRHIFVNKFGLPINANKITKYLGYPNKKYYRDRIINPNYLQTSLPEILTFLDHADCIITDKWPISVMLLAKNDDQNIEKITPRHYTRSKHIAYQYAMALISIGINAKIMEFNDGYCVCGINRDPVITNIEKLPQPTSCMAISILNKETPMFVTEGYIGIFSYKN